MCRRLNVKWPSELFSNPFSADEIDESFLIMPKDNESLVLGFNNRMSRK